MIDKSWRDVVVTERSGSSTNERKDPQRNLVLSRFMRFLKGFRRALNESHPAFALINTNVNKHLVWILTEREWYISVFWWRLVSNEHC